jgi:hypothetical protein
MTARFAAAATGLTAVLAGIAAGLGVFARGSGTFEPVVSARGEAYEMAVDGVYAYSSKALVAEGVGWDVFTLLIVVPALAVTTLFVVRQSITALLVSAGLLGYAAYMYLEYAVTWAFGPMFPLHVTILAVSTAGLVAIGVAVSRLGGPIVHGFPRRAFAALTGGMAALLTVMWIARIVEGLTSAAPVLAGETTMTVQALDLGLVVPISAVLAVAVLLGSRAGMVASAAFSVLFVATCAAIGSMMVSAWLMTGEPTVVPLSVFALAAVAGLFVARRSLAAVSTSLPGPRPRAPSALGVGVHP